jgi:hypothetical protein
MVGRGAVNQKGPESAFLAALHVIRSAGRKPPVNLVLVAEGSWVGDSPLDHRALAAQRDGGSTQSHATRRLRTAESPRYIDRLAKAHPGTHPEDRNEEARHSETAEMTGY